MTLDPGLAARLITGIRTHTAQRTGCPEWDTPGVSAALIATSGPPGAVLAAAALAAEDPTLRLPSSAAFTAHWPKNASEGPRIRHTQRCPDHPEHDAPHDHGGDMTPEEIAEAARLARAAIRVPVRKEAKP